MSWTEADNEDHGDILDVIEEDVDYVEYDEKAVQPPPTTKKKHTRISQEQKERMLELQEMGMSAMQIANQLGLRRTTVYEALKRTNQQLKMNILKLRRMQTKKHKKKINKKLLLTDEQVDMVNKWLEEDSQMSLRALVDRLAFRAGVRVSESYMSQILDDFTYSMRRTDLDPSEMIMNDKRLTSARQVYAKTFIDLHRHFSEDQFVFSHFGTFSLCVRTNPTGEFSNERGLKRSLYTSLGIALNRKKVLQYSFQFMAPEEDHLVEFYHKLLQQLSEDNSTQSCVIILDDNYLGAAKNEILKAITDADHRYLLVPPASAFLNGVESILSGWRDITKRVNANNEKTLTMALEGEGTFLTPEDCEHCYLSAVASVLPCVNERKIEGTMASVCRAIKK